MASKDKFKKMQEGGAALSSFQDIVQQAQTVAAIEQQAAGQRASQTDGGKSAEKGLQGKEATQRMTHLPNPSISVREYNMATQYCYQFDNMTRQDWMELAIIEKLHRDGQMPDEEFRARQAEIQGRPPRGQRKNTKAQTNKRTVV